MPFFKSSSNNSPIPPNMQKIMGKQMNKQMQQAMSKSMTKSAQKVFTKQMQKSMNQSMNRYAKDYSKQVARAEMASYGNSFASAPTEPNQAAPNTSHVNPNVPGASAQPGSSRWFAADSSAAAGNSSDPLLPQAGAPQTPPENQFDFITQQGGSGFKQSRFTSFGAGSSKQRIFVVAGGGVVLLIIVILFYSIVLSRKPNATAEVSLAQQQTQLINISNKAVHTAAQQVTRNLAVTAEFGLTTSQNQLLGYLKNRHETVSPKELALGQSTTITEELTNAQATSDYDPTYIQVMQAQLTKYLQSLSQAEASTTSLSEHQVLQTSAATATLLQTQANNAAQSLPSS